MALVLAGSPALFPVPPVPPVPHQARHNIQAQPAYMNACVARGSMSRTCIAETVAAIDHARANEAMRHPRLILPDNYRSLTRAQQAFVVIDLERVDRGLRPIAGMVGQLNHAAKQAAAAGRDPRAPSSSRDVGVRVYRSVYARDYGVLAADYLWMYDDGYSSGARQTANTNCAAPQASGCWSHRAAILHRFKGWSLLLGGMGNERAEQGANTVAAILAGGSGGRPHFTYTWRDAKEHGADGWRVG